MSATITPNPELKIDEPQEWVLLPEGSILQQNGVPVRLITGVVVCTARGNMQFLTGHHLCSVSPGPV